MRSLPRAVVLAAVLASVACSGGGDESSKDVGLVLDRSSIAFTARQGDPLPFAQVHATVTSPEASYIAAGYPPGTPLPNWLTLSATGSGASWTIGLAVTTTSLPPATYQTTVRVGIARADQSLIGYRDVAVTYTVSPRVSVSPASLTFTYVIDGPTDTKALSVSGTAGVSFTASASEPWVTLAPTSGTTPATITIGLAPVGLAAGSHQAAITIAAAGQTLTVPVTLAVSAPALTVSTGTLAFAGVNGAPIATQDVQVAMNNGTSVAFTATPGAGWIVLGASGGTTPATITVGLDPSVGPLAAGSHSGAVTLSAPVGGSPLTASVNVQATLARATLTVPQSLVLGGAQGRDFAAKPLQVSLDTGTAAHGWTAVASDGWMSLSAAAGDAAATPVSIDVSPVAAGLTGGVRTGSIAFTATVNGDTVTGSVPVTFNLDAHKLLASATGVAFAKTPGPTRLTRTLRVTDSLGLAAPWTATSDQAWLTVTTSGTAPGDLVLTANPSEVGSDAYYLATVTISSSDSSVENTETIRAGFSVGSTAPTAVTLAGSFASPTTDPVRPYAYVHTSGSDVSVYNVHTGALAGTIPAVAGTLGGMAVSGDGSTLYAVDKATWKLVPVDLDTWTVGSAVSLANTTNPNPRVAWTRTNGQPLVVVTDGTVRDPADGRVLWSSGYGSSYAPPVAASLDGSVFCAPSCRSLSWTAVGGGVLAVGSRAGSLGEDDGALSPDGSVEYEPYMTGYTWYGYSTTTGQSVIQLASNKPYPNNVEVGWDGRIYAGRSYSNSSEPDVFVYTPAGALIGTLDVATSYNHSLADGAMALSGDGLRIVAVTTDYFVRALRFVTVP